MSAIIAITVATPMTMPSSVSSERSGLPRNVPAASRRLSRKERMGLRPASLRRDPPTIARRSARPWRGVPAEWRPASAASRGGIRHTGRHGDRRNESGRIWLAVAAGRAQPQPGRRAGREPGRGERKRGRRAQPAGQLGGGQPAAPAREELLRPRPLHPRRGGPAQPLPRCEPGEVGPTGDGPGRGHAPGSAPLRGGEGARAHPLRPLPRGRDRGLRPRGREGGRTAHRGPGDLLPALEANRRRRPARWWWSPPASRRRGETSTSRSSC